MANKEFVRFKELNRWLAGVLPSHPELIRVSGVFTHDEEPKRWLDLVEVDGVGGLTVRLLVPKDPPPASGPKRDPASFCSGTQADWGNGWAPILLGSLLAPPKVDPVRLQDIMSDSRRIRVVCDTSALASGVLSWLFAVFDGRLDAITSAVVDREIAGWADRHPNMWLSNDVHGWALKTKYLLARRVLETAPDGVVVERLSPDQGALIASKLRDDDGDKAPDADMLMVELARRLMREQPPSARLVYLTGDRNHARSAASAIGAENVLFAASDGPDARKILGSTVVRAWWHPGGPMGRLIVPPLSHLFWNLLAACPTLRIDARGKTWVVRNLAASENGVPSDWQDPWLVVREGIGASASAAPVTSGGKAESEEGGAAGALAQPGSPAEGELPAAVGATAPAETVRDDLNCEREGGAMPETSLAASRAEGDESAASSPWREDAVPAGDASAPTPPGGEPGWITPDLLVAASNTPGDDLEPRASQGAGSVAATSSMSGTSSPVPEGASLPKETTEFAGTWLLPPVPAREIVRAKASYRPAPNAIFPLLWRALSGSAPRETIPQDTGREAVGLLVALGALVDDGGPGPRLADFRSMWMSNDLDALHAEFMRLPSYRTAVDSVRADPLFTPTSSRQVAQLTMARCLGQVARLEKTAKETWIGDSPLRASDLVEALMCWMPEPEKALGVADLCFRAAVELRVTPVRLERALVQLWRDFPSVPFEGQTGGEAVPGYAERIVELSDAGFGFKEVAPGGLTLGRRGPVRFIVRTR